MIEPKVTIKAKVSVFYFFVGGEVALF